MNTNRKNTQEVSISRGNTKMGAIPSVSLPSIVTCRKCDCMKKCYAHKLERIRPSVREAYQRNLELLNNEPEKYWAAVEDTVAMSRFFRYHVSGDIPNDEYFGKMVDIAEQFPNTEMLCFTKKFDIVNRYIDNHGGDRSVIPNNLHMIFSGWEGLKMENPYNLPEAHVEFRNGKTTAREDAHRCGGNCTVCSRTGTGCWVLKDGEQVVFHEH